MTADEFIARCKTYRRYNIFTKLLFLTAFAAATALGKWLEREGGCASDRCFFLIVLAAILFGSVMIYTLVVGPKKRAQALGLNCPSCGKSLIGCEAQPGLVTGHCAFCRVRVLDS